MGVEDLSSGKEDTGKDSSFMCAIFAALISRRTIFVR